MKDWKKVRLDACCRIVGGSTPSTSVEEFWNGNICWATPKDLSELEGPYLDDTPRKITESGLENCAAEILPPGAVLFSSRAPIGHVAVNRVPMATNQGFKNFVPNPELLESQFLFHWLRANRDYLESLGNGATFKEVSKAVVARIEIPLPSLPEQQRIMSILDQAATLQIKRRHSLAKLDKLTQTLFFDLFGDPVDNPKGWPVRPVADFVSAFQGGKSVLAENSEQALTKNRILKVSAVTNLVYKPEESKPVPDDYAPPREHFVQDGDLLFSRANTTELVGAVAYVWKTASNLLLPDKLWRFVWKTPTSVAPLFIMALFHNASFRRELGKRATGTSGSMKNISQQKVMAIETIVPPLELQQRFAQQVRAIERLHSSARASETATNDLFASLQHRAFRGEL